MFFRSFSQISGRFGLRNGEVRKILWGRRILGILLWNGRLLRCSIFGKCLGYQGCNLLGNSDVLYHLYLSWGALPEHRNQNMVQAYHNRITSKYQVLKT